MWRNKKDKVSLHCFIIDLIKCLILYAPFSLIAATAACAMNGKTALPIKAWKAEYAKLTAERKTLNQRYLALKEDVKEAEQIRKSVYSILQQEQREQQPRRAQDMEQ